MTCLFGSRVTKAKKKKDLCYVFFISVVKKGVLSYVCKSVRGENKFFMESQRLQISKPIIQVADTAHEIPNVVDNPKNVGT